MGVPEYRSNNYTRACDLESHDQLTRAARTNVRPPLASGGATLHTPRNVVAVPTVNWTFCGSKSQKKTLLDIVKKRLR